MMWTLSLMLIVLWLLGLVTGYTLGGVIHVLALAAVAAAILGGLAHRHRRAGGLSGSLSRRPF